MRSASTKVLLATGAIIASGLANASPAPAAPEGTDGAEAAQQVLTFNKGSDPTNGRLTFVGANSRASWRAGSGNGANWSNECVRNEGNLPNGTYNIRGWFDNYNGDLIHGRAVQLDDKVCSDGHTKRTELFIHSEQTVDNTQGGTEGTRWDGDNDYKSNGCIKLQPNDIAALFKHSAGNPGAGDAILKVVS
jgi:hypothetical protein